MLFRSIFLVDFMKTHRYVGYSEHDLYGETGCYTSTLVCWLIGALSGLMVTKTGFIDGPLAVGVFESSSLGLFVSFTIALVLHVLVRKTNIRVIYG